jgi:hypothetical protein
LSHRAAGSCARGCARARAGLSILRADCS